MFRLEKGSRKFNCPSCGNKTFVRYQNETGEYLPSDVGRCDRDSKCGYHFTAKMFFDANLNLTKNNSTVSPTDRLPAYTGEPEPDYIPLDAFELTQIKKSSAFSNFLFKLFFENRQIVRSVLQAYRVGAFDDYTCFPSIDRENRICRAKLIRFNQTTGKRLKGSFDTSSLPAKLKLKKDFQYKQIFFGEHLLPQFPDLPVAIVEAEKTAIIGSICEPEILWLASGSKQWLKVERLHRFDNRKVILYPDADGFEQWNEVAQDARRFGLSVHVSTVIEKHATPEQKANGYDLADYRIYEQRQINEYNSIVDNHNRMLDEVKNDTNLFRQFNDALDRQIESLKQSGLSKAEAVAETSKETNVRTVVIDILTKRIEQSNAPRYVETGYYFQREFTEDRYSPFTTAHRQAA